MVKRFSTRSVLGRVGLGTALVAGVVMSVAPLTASASGPARQGFPSTSPVADLPVGVAWGLNGQSSADIGGAVGDGTFLDRLAPVVVNGGTALDNKEISAVDAGSATSCGLTDGKAACWGSNSEGALGTNNPASRSAVPAVLTGLLAGKSVTAVSVGGLHACAIADDSAFCWGQAGQLGSGSSNGSQVPVKVDTSGVLAGKKISAVSVGGDHTCVIADGQVFCWGDNQLGQLGTGETSASKLSPVAVTTEGVLHGRTVSSISAGWSHTCALADGKAFCWGLNTSGQLGNGTLVTLPRPVQVDFSKEFAGDVVVKSISAGGIASCAVAGEGDDRLPLCWGDNVHGSLGVDPDNDDDHPRPGPVGGVQGKTVDTVALGTGNACLLTGGKPFCWGSGPIGNNSESDVTLSAKPVFTGGVLNGRTTLELSAGQGFTTGVAVNTPTFADVTSANQFFGDVAWLYGKGIATFAPGPKSFRPTDAVTRGEMAQFVFRFVNPGLDDPTCNPNSPRVFLDVAAASASCGAVEWLAGQKIVKSGGSFRPGLPLTRSTMADWLYRSHHPGVADQFCSNAQPVFSDVDLTTPSCGNIKWIARVGVNRGFGDGSYRPGDPVTRQAIARFFHRMDGLLSH